MARLQDVGRFTALRARQAARLARFLIGGTRPADLVAYRGYGSAARVYLHGRALARPVYARGKTEDPAWRNLLNAYRRARSNPIAHAEVRLEFGGAASFVTADDEGFFSEWINPRDEAATKPGWREASASLISPATSAAAVSATSQVLIPHPDAHFAVISDIDDTVIQSHVTSFVRAARAVLLGNALTRLPFEGVAEFYHGLSRGGADGVGNPLFYVSSSPWNLYDVIDDFLAVQGIPHGPLLLRDWDVVTGALGGGSHHQHKEAAIREIMQTYPRLPFILIGDSGQRDPEIYSRIVHEYPARILAVYIRDVVRTEERSGSIEALATEVAGAGSTLLLVQDTRQAAEHAADRGWIVEEEVAAVEREAAADAGTIPGKKQPPL